MKARRPKRRTTFPAKTAWTALWFALAGLCALHVHGLLRPSEPALETEATPAGPLPAPQAPFPEVLPETQTSQTALAEPGDSAARLYSLEEARGDEMCSFYRALRGLGDDRDAARPVRVLHVGDSISTTDEISGRVRRQLQARFGDGGHGFVLLGKPWRWYRHQDVVHGSYGEWRARPVTSDPVGDGLYGLGGVGLESAARGASAWVGTVEQGPVGTKVRRFDLSYLEQPLGGTFDLLLDGAMLENVSTRAAAKSIVHRTVEVPSGQGRITLRVRGDGRLRVFGAALESGDPGVVYDTVAINGARAQALNLIDPSAWSAEVARREPSLLVVMLGANEGSGEKIGVSFYKQELGRLMTTLRSGSRQGSCLVVGPLDQLARDSAGRLRPRANPPKIASAQRDVAFEHGCAFFDTLSAMGGPGSLAAWMRIGMGGADLIHPTDKGAQQVGDWLADALLGGYNQFLEDDKPCASSVTTL